MFIEISSNKRMMKTVANIANVRFDECVTLFTKSYSIATSEIFYVSQLSVIEGDAVN